MVDPQEAQAHFSASGEPVPALAGVTVNQSRPILITPLVVVYLLSGILVLLLVHWGVLWGTCLFVLAWGTSKMKRWAWFANLGYCGLSIFGWFIGSFGIPVLLLFIMVTIYMLQSGVKRAFGVVKSRP